MPEYIEKELKKVREWVGWMRTEEKDMCLAAENWEMAVAIAVDLVKAEPKNPTTWILLAHAVRRAGNVEQEETVLLKARAWHPTDASIFLKLARCATVTGRIEEAKLRLEHAIALDENIRWVALHEEDLRPLWDWISGLEYCLSLAKVDASLISFGKAKRS
jgi:tetratricopeptide (TPR) repeat protein